MMEGKQTKKVGSYHITPQLLGQGTFSTVYLAYDRQHRPLAAKIIPLNFTTQQQTQLQQEINCLKKCEHQNIVKLQSMLKTQNNLYLFMEYCPQGTLQELLRKRSLSEQEAMHYFIQIIKGLKVLYTTGVVHRDLKSANILLSGKTIKIGDFGLAKKCRNGDMLTSYKGTPLNMAPEIIYGEQYTNKVDVYSAGTILYEMLVGHCPFIANTIPKIAKKSEEGPKFPPQIKISKQLRILITQMLQSNPQNRISIEQVQQYINNYVQKQREKRLESYRVLAKSVISKVGVMGALLSTFDYIKEPSSPVSMDLMLYGRLCHRLGTKV